MTGFREHFLDKYFGYRRRYVDAILERAPQRAGLAVLSEIARLGFVTFGSALCALIFWLLTVTATERAGGLGVWPAVFGLCALVATLFGALALGGIASALRDRARVEERARS